MTCMSKPLEQSQRNSELPMDRISGLPDELLIIILNFLPTKYAFLTTTLSRRWSYLFKEVNHLDFDDSLLFKCPSGVAAKHHGESCVRFRDFICKMLDHTKSSNVVSFHIKCADYCDGCFLKSLNPRCQVGLWLDAIMSHEIQDLYVEAPILLPHSLFTCKTLCTIKLNIYSVKNIPDIVFLPYLKVLHLKQSRYIDVDFVSRIFLGSPLLQEFSMDPCNWYGAIHDPLSISGPSLTKLNLNNKSQGIYGGFPRPLVTVVAPLLQSFYYVDRLAKSYSIKTTDHLVEAHLDIFLDSWDYADRSQISRSVRDLMQGVSSVKCLFLSARSIEAVTYYGDELPILSNLTKLELGCPTTHTTPTTLHVTLLRLLESFPNLEELIFSEGLFPISFREKDTVLHDYCGRHQVVRSCLKTHLKIVKIEHILGLKEELRIVEFFLKNGHILAQLIINKWEGRKSKFKVRKQLKRLARRKKNCLHFNDLYL